MMKRNGIALWIVLLVAISCLTAYAADGKVEDKEPPPLRIAACPEFLPVNLFGVRVGSGGSLRIELPGGASGYKEAVLLLRVDDVDASNEARMYLNNSGPLKWPDSLLGEGEHGGIVPLPIKHLRPGRNLVRFVFKDNLNGTTEGFRVLDAELLLFRDRSPVRTARMTREGASWGRPVDWRQQAARGDARSVSPSRGSESPTISDYFQEAFVARWKTFGGTWKKLADEIHVYDVDERDIYLSPEEPGWLEWVGLWKEKDDAIRACFAQITGNPGLDPSYRPWYGRGSREAWISFAKDYKMQVGPEDAASTTRLDYVALRTRDQGDMWENLGPNQEPSGANLRFVCADDGSLVNHGVANVRCRDGRIVSSLWPQEWKKGCLVGVRESTDGGKTWSSDQLIAPPGSDEEILKVATEENAMVELGDGRLLVLIRCDPGNPCQIYLTRTGPGKYTATLPSRTPMPHSGLPELARCRDGVIWYWGLDGIWYTADDGQTWQLAPVKFPSYYGKMIDAGPNRILCVTQTLTGDSPYPFRHDATVRQFRFSYQRSAIVEQSDVQTSLQVASRKEADFSDLHLRADVRVDGATGLAFRVQPDGQSYYVFAVVLPGAEAFNLYLPPDLQRDQLSANYPHEAPFMAAPGNPMCLLGRVDNGKVTVLRGMRLAYLPRGSWLRMQVKVTGDLIQGAVNSDPNPTYLGVRDAKYPSGGVGLFTHASTGAFQDFRVWSRPQMIRDLWR